MMQSALARNGETAAATSRPSGPRAHSRRLPEFSRWFRWLYAARPSLMPTVYVPGPVVVARKV